MDDLSFLEALAVLGLAGLGIGVGLVLGAFVARALRRYMSEEDLKPYQKKKKKDDDDAS